MSIWTMYDEQSEQDIILFQHRDDEDKYKDTNNLSQYNPVTDRRVQK